MKLLNFLFIALFLAAPVFGQKIIQPVNFSASSAEQNILEEINTARTNPQRYITYLEEYKRLFKGNILYLPGNVRMQTNEGAKAVDEAISFLKSSQPIAPFQVSGGLVKSANLQLTDLIENILLGHTGKDGSSLSNRLEKFGFVGNMYAESMLTSVQAPREIVMTLIIDDGLESRGDRKYLFSTKLRQIGIAYGKNNKDESLCVVTYADSFRERASPLSATPIY